MVQIKVTTKGVRDLSRSVSRLKGAVRDAAKREIAISAVNIHRRAVKSVPVDTGRLRSSIRFEVSDGGLVGEVFTDVEYADFVEFGTSRSGAQPYLFPAWDRERPKLIKRLKGLA